MEPDVALVLDHTTNNAVVKLPGRRFPGSVIQGDSLSSLVKDISKLRGNLEPESEQAYLLDDLLERLQERLDIYEACLERNGIEKPYFDPK